MDRPGNKNDHRCQMTSICKRLSLKTFCGHQRKHQLPFAKGLLYTGSQGTVSAVPANPSHNPTVVLSPVSCSWSTRRSERLGTLPKVIELGVKHRHSGAKGTALLHWGLDVVWGSLEGSRGMRNSWAWCSEPRPPALWQMARWSLEHRWSWPLSWRP